MSDSHMASPDPGTETNQSLDDLLSPTPSQRQATLTQLDARITDLRKELAFVEDWLRSLTPDWEGMESWYRERRGRIYDELRRRHRQRRELLDGRSET